MQTADRIDENLCSPRGMTSCTCVRSSSLRSGVINDHYQTSSTRSHYYENTVDHPLNHLRVKRESRKDLRSQDSVMLDLFTKSIYKRTFDAKYWDDRKPQDWMNRSSFGNPDLRSLHERCMKYPVMPMKVCKSSTADHYSMPEKMRADPLPVPSRSPVEESTCPVRASGRDEFPSVPPNQPGYYKRLDIFLSSSQLGHPRFTLDQQNGVARKDVVTFYDAKGTPKCRGFGPKKMTPIGSYFHRDETEADKVRPKSSVCRVPYFGKTSEYAARFDSSPSGLGIYRQDEIHFPPIFPSSAFDVLAVPNMYCTESCHLGTGWPLRASVHLGKATGTL